VKCLLFFLLLALSPFMLYAQADDCHPHFSGSDRTDFEKGIEAYNNKRYQQCITLMRKVSQRNRTAADPYFYLGVASVKAGDKPATIRNYFNRLFKLCPDYPNALAYFYMGVVHYSYKEYSDAVVQLNRYFDIANQLPNPAYDVVYEEASTYLYWSEFLANAQLNEAPFNPVVLRGPSSRSDELLPYISPNGREIYFHRLVQPSKTKTFYDKNNESKVPRLFCSQWKDTAFTSGTPMPSPFNQDRAEGNITLTADGQTLYCAAINSNAGYDNCDILVAHRKNGIWQELENVGRNVNGERTWESQPSITPDGQYLYFASNRSGGQGGTDIWVCRRLPNGDWSRAENLGPSVNTPGNEKCPFIHADSKTLYFASNGWQGFGGYDMYFINLTDTYLQRPTNLGLPINTEDDDICFGVTTDGKYGYFANKSPQWTGIGGTDIFTFELYPAAQPEEMAIVEGSLRTPDGKPTSASISVLRQKTDADIYLVGDDGRFALALPVKSSATVTVNAPDCMPRILQGNAMQLKRDLNAADFSPLPIALFGRYPLPNIKQLSWLDPLADFLLQNPRIHIRIEATTMESSKAIHDYLLSRQLRPERLEYKPNPALANPQIVITQN